MKNSKCSLAIFSLLIGLVCLGLAAPGAFSATKAGGAAQALYVGAAACESCHEEQYASYQKNSRKAHSWRSILKMRPKLTEAELRGCYACHTTGYNKPGGFVSFEQTPELSNVGCESCHGPGSAHAESGDAAAIRRTPKLDECLVCHNAQRVENFNFKPMLYHGGH